MRRGLMIVGAVFLGAVIGGCSGRITGESVTVESETVEWYSRTPTVAQVNATTGEITPVSPGLAEICSWRYHIRSSDGVQVYLGSPACRQYEISTDLKLIGR